MGINHGGPHIAVPQQLLDGSYVIIPLQQVAGETVAKGMGACALADLSGIDRLLDCLLHVRFMQMVSSVFPGLGLQGQVFGGEIPVLRGEIRGRSGLPVRGESFAAYSIDSMCCGYLTLGWDNLRELTESLRTVPV